MVVDKELYKKLHYKKGNEICPYCGHKINGKSTEAVFYFKDGCPNEAHKFWQEAEKMIKRDENVQG